LQGHQGHPAILLGTGRHSAKRVAAGAYLAPGRSTVPWPPDKGKTMSKGMDRKKETKKKPEKTMKEKRAAKSEKKAGKA
jgi:hypothetical protein